MNSRNTWKSRGIISKDVPTQSGNLRRRARFQDYGSAVLLEKKLVVSPDKRDESPSKVTDMVNLGRVQKAPGNDVKQISITALARYWPGVRVVVNTNSQASTAMSRTTMSARRRSYAFRMKNGRTI